MVVGTEVGRDGTHIKEDSCTIEHGRNNYQVLNDQVMRMLDNGDAHGVHNLLCEKLSNGDGDAARLLGDMSRYGVGVAEDTEMAKQYYEKGYVLGCAPCASELGDMCAGESQGNPRIQRQAASWYLKAAEAGDARGMGMLAQCYWYGEGVTEDNAQAFSWGIKAAQAGEMSGMEIAGLCYASGLGAPRNQREAVHWLSPVCQEYEDEHCMYKLACCLADPYEDFHILPTQEMLSEAYDWISKAVDKGYTKAKVILSWFFEMGKVVPKDYNIAHQYLQAAVDEGDEVAANLITRYRKNLYGDYYIP